VDHQHIAPHILNFAFSATLADVIINHIPELALSTASACQGKGTEGSYVLRAMGYTVDEVKSSLRLSLGRFTTAEEIKIAVDGFTRVMER
jgi:cysteine desulfurase